MLTDVGATPVIQSGGYDNGFGGGMGIWAILLLALLGGNGFGGYGRNAGGAQIDNSIWESQSFGRLENGQSAIQNAISQVGQGVCSSTYALNDSIKDGNYSTAMAIQDSKYQLGNGLCSTTYELSTAIRDCCCNTQRGIDSVNFNNERNTNAIVQAGNANTQRILDFLNCAEMKEAQTKIFEQGQALSEARIIAAMKPVAPVPAYIQPNPYDSYRYNNCNCNC